MKLQKNSIHRAFLLLLVACLMLPTLAHAFDGFERFHQAGEGRAFFDLDTSKLNAESLPFVLGGILITYDELEAMGITPDFVVTFRGLKTTILTYGSASEEVRAMVTGLDQLGVTVQVCAKANYLSGANPYDILEEIEIVDNAWITSMQLQNKRRGYAYITF